MTQATAAANGHPATTTASTKTTTKEDAHAFPLEARLALKLKAAHRYRSRLHFFETHRRLLSTEHGPIARTAMRRAERGLRRARREIAYYTRLIRLRDARREAHRLAKAPPRVAICGVFGRYCREALSVAWCESRMSTHAQNGQYLGLFQMGSSERRLFGHGRTAHEQALAAHRYFVHSGRDWSPWSCRWAAF